jgi:predicted anti-sigma-YlaC factor YlaD
MNCDKYQEMISAGLDGQLSPEDARILQAHLETCAECREFAGVSENLRRLASTEKRALLPAELEREILGKTIGRRHAGFFARFLQTNYQIPRPVVWAAGVALLLLAANAIVGTRPEAIQPPSTMAGNDDLASRSDGGVRTIVLTEADVVYRQSIAGGVTH